MGKIISVIVPVYNVESYISKCIESILNQSFIYFELILINDGSTDDSGSICEKYALQDNRINVIHKNNGGLASACKCGIENSTGKYIVFVDSDDWIDDDMLETLFTEVEKNNAQIVLCHAIREYRDKQVLKKMHLLDSRLYKRNEIKNEIFSGLISTGYRGQKKISNSRCAKLFDAELVKKNLKYYSIDVINGEDLQLTFAIILDAESIFCINNYYPYHYRVNENSLTRSYINNFIEKSIDLYNHIDFISNDKNVFDFKEQLNIWFTNRVLVAINQEFSKKNDFDKKITINKIDQLSTNDDLQRILGSSNISRFSLFDRIILYLIKMKSSALIYYILSVKREMKKLIRN